MAQWIRVIEELPIVEVKPFGNEGFTETELFLLLGTNNPAKMLVGEDGKTIVLFEKESNAPINKRAGDLLNIPTVKQLKEQMLANGKQPDEALLAKNEEERAWEIRGNVLFARLKRKGETNGKTGPMGNTRNDSNVDKGKGSE